VHAAAVMSPRPTSPPELDDVTLGRASRGDAAAFRALVERYQRPVYEVLYRMLALPAGVARVEELTQETFVKVHGALARFEPDGPGRLSTWILTIATRLALNELRRGPPAVPLDQAPEPAGPDTDGADRQLERRRLGRALAAAIAALPASQRAAIVLRAYHDLDYRDIAAILEIDVGTVKSRIARGRARLRELLREVYP
jgi:RNA polymerase sigma-70 factor, ECF subfamily